jgi:hypothetical protein
MTDHAALVGRRDIPCCINCAHVFGRNDVRGSYGAPGSDVGPFCERCYATIKAHEETRPALAAASPAQEEIRAAIVAASVKALASPCPACAAKDAIIARETFQTRMTMRVRAEAAEAECARLRADLKAADAALAEWRAWADAEFTGGYADATSRTLIECARLRDENALLKRSAGVLAQTLDDQKRI